MSEAKLTSKGQTTIPKDIREGLGMRQGMRLSFTIMPNGTVLLRGKNKSIPDLAGKLRRKRQKRVPTELLSR